MEIIKVFKVVRRMQDRFISAWMQKDCRVEYFVDKFVQSHVSETPLMAFANLPAARYWVQNTFYSTPGCAIFSAEAIISPISVKKFSNTNFTLSHYEAKFFWENAHFYQAGDYCYVPKDTVFCSQIKLLDEIENLN